MTRTRAAGAAVLASVLLAACSQGGNEVTVDVRPTETPSGSASTPASSAPPASTAPAAPTTTPKVVDTIATGLATPWGLAFLPDGSAVVTERDSARVLRISGPRHRVQQVGTIGEAAPQGEGGLLGVAVDPDFATNRLLYFYVSTSSDNRIVRAELTGTTLGATTTIFDGIPLGPIHDGGRLAFGPDGFLYASTGEGGEPERAQDEDSLGGKILRLTTTGEPAPGNPSGTAVYSLGHRNVQGLAFVDDQLWASEFGQNTFDELNRIDPGSNYGWPEIEGMGGTDQGYVDPQAVWSTDQASPSGLAFLDGALYMAALRGTRLWRIPVTGEDAGEPQGFFIGEYGRMRTVAATPDGDLWVTTSNQDGRGDPVAGDDRILLVRP